MSVNIDFVGQLGNNLFQYALGRIIAEHLGFELRIGAEYHCQELSPFIELARDINSPATLSSLSMYFENAPLNIHGRRYIYPIESFELRSTSAWAGQMFPLESVLKDATPRHIRLRGYFQRFELFRAHRESIRRWLKPAVVSTPFSIAENDILVNIRRGLDFGMRNWTLPLSYYERVLSALPAIGRVYICGAHIDDEIRHRFRSYNPVYFDGSPIEHFAFISRFKRMILANSTFSWWAAFLSDAHEIYGPHSGDGLFFAFTGFRDVDLHMYESRYRPIEVPNAAKIGFSIQRLGSPQLVSNYGGGAVVGSRLGPNSYVHVGASDVDWINWLIQQIRPVPLAEIHNRCVPEKANDLLNRLAHIGLVRILPSYGEHNPCALPTV